MAESVKELMSIDDFLRAYSIGKDAYYTQVKKNLLKVTRVGQRVFIKRIDAEAWLAKLGMED